MASNNKTQSPPHDPSTECVCEMSHLLLLNSNEIIWPKGIKAMHALVVKEIRIVLAEQHSRSTRTSIEIVAQDPQVTCSALIDARLLAGT
jgi:hypothetical protein